MDTVFVEDDETAARLATHEAVCAERYRNLLSRLARLEAIVLGAIATVIGAMGTMLLTLLHAGYRP